MRVRARARARARVRGFVLFFWFGTNHVSIYLFCSSSFSQAADLVRDQRIRGRTLDEIAAYLANTALQLRSKDNVTVLVVFLEWRVEDVDRKEREARFAAPQPTLITGSCT